MDYLTGALLAVTGAVAALIIGMPLAHVVNIVASGTLWASIDALSNALVPAIGALATVIIWLHRRVKQLEETQTEHATTLYGHTQDYLSDGVTKEIYKVSGEMEEFREEFRHRFDTLEERLDDVEDEEE